MARRESAGCLGFYDESGGLMKRFTCITFAVAFALSSPAHSSAQSSIFVGGAATFPVGSLGGSGRAFGANTGWQGTVGAQFAMGESGLTLGPRVYYGSNAWETAGDKSNLFGGTALINYGFGDPLSVNPFLWGEVGVLSHAFKSDSAPSTEVTSTAGTLAGGAGIGFPLGGVSGFVAAGYNSHLGGDVDTTYFGVYAGVSFAVGGG